MPGLMQPSEWKILTNSLRNVLKKKLSSEIFVELGVRRADSSVEIFKIIRESKRPAKYIGVDVDPKAEVHWGKKVGRGTNELVTDFFLGTTDAARVAVEHAAWILVDACHCFECATSDIEHWGSKIVSGGNLVIHDTTPRRQHYEKNFQHNHTRRFGVYQAIQKSAFLKSGWKIIDTVDDVNGITVYERF